MRIGKHAHLTTKPKKQNPRFAPGVSQLPLDDKDVLALAELSCAACAVQTNFLTFNFTRIARH
jgi:hypothetical protein